VRELEHAVERMVALSTEPLIDVDPTAETESRGQITLEERLAAVERGIIVDELERCRGNRSETARRLGISRPTLYERLDRYGLKDEK
jgi:DNA-binding NtrC family response regulator